MSILIRGVLSLGLLLAVASPALADAVNTRPISPLGDNGIEDTLQEIFDDITYSGPGIDAVNDQHEAALFQSTASGGALATFVIEVTSNASGQSIGLYDALDSSKQVVLFGGSDTAGDQALVSFLADGSIKVNFADTGVDFSSRAFGFFLDTGSSIFYSEDSRNGGTARALVYQGDDETKLQLPGFLPGTFTSNDWIFAFEDGSDGDFQDAVFLVESIQPIPEPGTLLLCGAAVLGFAWSRRRKRA